MVKKVRRVFTGTGISEHLRAFYASGLSAHAYAGQNGISAGTMRRWLNGEGYAEHRKAAKAKRPESAVEVDAIPTPDDPPLALVAGDVRPSKTAIRPSDRNASPVMVRALRMENEALRELVAALEHRLQLHELNA